MADFNNAVMTNEGAALLAQCEGGFAKMQFTAMVTGNGEYTEAEKQRASLQQRTSLKNQKQSFGFSKIEMATSTSVLLTGVITNADLSAGYYVREVGIYAKNALDEDSAPILYSIAIANVADYLPPYNGLTPSTITQEYYATVSNSADVTIQAGSGALATADDLNAAVAQISECKEQIESIQAAITALQENEGAWEDCNRLYYGRDLTVVFADEIANYSDEWAWIKARLIAHNISGLRVGDYIPITVGTESHQAQIAGINTYRKTCDTQVGYHIDWITRDCYGGSKVQWNTSNANQGTSKKKSPYLASDLASWLESTLLPLLPSKLSNVIVSKRYATPTRYTSGTTLTDDTGWEWADLGKLWVPYECEVFDSCAWSTHGYGYGQDVQYPLFANSFFNRIKGAGPGGGRTGWWLASAGGGSSIYVVYVGIGGNSYSNNANNSLYVPVCFRTAEG